MMDDWLWRKPDWSEVAASELEVLRDGGLAIRRTSGVFPFPFPFPGLGHGVTDIVRLQFNRWLGVSKSLKEGASLNC